MSDEHIVQCLDLSSAGDVTWKSYLVEVVSFDAPFLERFFLLGRELVHDVEEEDDRVLTRTMPAAPSAVWGTPRLGSPK